MITLVQLEYITVLDTYRHFATAAEKCFVTQPTLSMQIKKLEDHLGVIIFDRTKQPVVPTEQGMRIIAQARVVLQEADRIGLIISDLQDRIAGELRIGLIPTISPYLLPMFAGGLKRSYPDIRLKVEEAITERIEEMLIKDMLDVGIVVTPLNNRNIIEEPVYYEEMMIYHHPGHRFSGQSIIQVEQIDHEDLWLLADGHCFRNQVVNFCDIRNPEHTELPYEFEGGSISTLMKIIDLEGGYTLIPELALLDGANQAQVRHFSRIKPLREVSLVYTRKFVKTKLIGLVAEFIRAAVPEHMLDKRRGTLVEWR